MLFLENGQASAFRTTSVGEGVFGCTAASTVDVKGPLGLPSREGTPIPRVMELMMTSPINAIAKANAWRWLPHDATRSVGRMRAALCGGIWVTGDGGVRCSSDSNRDRFGKMRTETRYPKSE